MSAAGQAQDSPSDYIAVEVKEAPDELITELFSLENVAAAHVEEGDNPWEDFKILKIYRQGDLDMNNVYKICKRHTEIGAVRVKKEIVINEPEDEFSPPEDEEEQIFSMGNQVDVTHYLGGKEKMAVLASFLVRSAKLWYRFKISFIFTLISMVIAIMIWFVMGEVLGTIAFTNDYFTYVLVGVVLNQYIMITITTYLDTLKGIYWQNQLEIYLTSPARLGTFFLSTLVWTYLYATINVLIYFTVGIGIFGANLGIPTALDGFYLVIILFLLITALSGIGLISASMFFLADAKGDVEPVSWFVMVVTGLVSGVFYPTQVLFESFPPLYYLSRAMPQTYAIETIRYIMIPNDMVTGGVDPLFLSPVLVIFILAIFAVILFPLGEFMFGFAVRKGEKDGKLAKWS